MLQVLTNSSTCFGRSVTCVSRSLQWMTLTPSWRARWLNSCAAIRRLISSAALPLTFLSAIRLWPMSIRPCFVKWEIRPGLAPCSITAVAPFSFHLAVILRRAMWRQYSVRWVGGVSGPPA